MTNDEESLKVALAMKQYGGSFVACLGEALIHADNDNTERIKAAFPEYWAEYKKYISVIKIIHADNDNTERIKAALPEYWAEYKKYISDIKQ
jgi:hypothetical protein